MCSKDVRSIVSSWLESNGYDGLFNENGECGCSIDDLMPCENSIAGLGDCVPAYRFECGRCSKWAANMADLANGWSDCEVQVPDYDEIFSTNPDFCEPDYIEG